MRTFLSVLATLSLVTAVVVGWQFVPSLPQLGQLPGDVVIHTNEIRLYIPAGTGLAICLLFNGLLWTLRKLG